MGWIASATPAPANQTVPGPCKPSDPKRKPLLFNFPAGGTFYSPPGFNFTPYTFTQILSINEETITLPPGSFLLQDGAIAPIYPTKLGTFVFDLYLKKWGKSAGSFKILFEMSPINLISSAIIPFEIFGSDTAILDAAGKIYLHDKWPLDSKISWGKIGYFRKGFTEAQEVKLQFADLSSGLLSIEGSYDGKNLDPARQAIENFTNANEVTLFGGLSARWYNVTVQGLYDISGLEFRGNIRGRR